jgi:hypothetical protein
LGFGGFRVWLRGVGFVEISVIRTWEAGVDDSQSIPSGFRGFKNFRHSDLGGGRRRLAVNEPGGSVESFPRLLPTFDSLELPVIVFGRADPLRGEGCIV